MFVFRTLVMYIKFASPPTFLNLNTILHNSFAIKSAYMSSRTSESIPTSMLSFSSIKFIVAYNQTLILLDILKSLCYPAFTTYTCTNIFIIENISNFLCI